MSMVLELIKKQFGKRFQNPNVPAIKINLYNGDEVRAVTQAINNLEDYYGLTIPDCFMVGDSLLTTHMGRKSTQLETIEEQDTFLNYMFEAIADVRSAINENYMIEERPYLIGDLPDGTTSTASRLLNVTEKMFIKGVDVVKLEISTKNDLDLLSLLTKNGILVAAHIGYSPQKNQNRQYGQSLMESLELMELAQLARDNGACAIILERVAEVVNQALCQPNYNALPVYSIFSGKVAVGGGQNLNVWDSVYKPGFKALFFPPTAQFTFESHPNSYTNEKIAECFEQLLRLTLKGEFPKSPTSRLSQEEIDYLLSLDPWSHSFDDIL